MSRFATAAAAALGAIAAWSAAFAEQASAVDSGGANPFDHIVPLVQPGGSPPSTAFVDQRGARVRLADLRGDAVAVAFVYTRCRDACPIITRKLGAARASLSGVAARLVEVSIDPQHDTPAAIAQYASEYRIQAPGWLILTGRPQDVDDFDRRMGVQAIGAGGDEIVHNERMVLLAPDGTVSDIIEGSSWTPADLAAQLRTLAGASSSPLARLDLALGAALAFCGGALSGRAGIGDLIASLLVLGALGAAFAWVVRRTSATNA